MLLKKTIPDGSSFISTKIKLCNEEFRKCKIISSCAQLTFFLFLLIAFQTGVHADSFPAFNPLAESSVSQKIKQQPQTFAMAEVSRLEVGRSMIYRALDAWRFALIIQLAAAALILLLMLLRYRRRSEFLPRGSFIDFARLQWRQHPYLACLLTVSDVFLVSNHLLARGKAAAMWDADSAYAAYQILVSDFARAGKLLQWDPWSDGGMPTGSDPQVGAHSPLNILIGLLTDGSFQGFTIYWLLIWWLGALGIFLLAHHFKAPPWGGAVAALGFLFNGFYTGHAEHTAILVSFSLTPFVFWRLDTALLSGKIQPAVEAGAIWGLSALSGYPAQTIMTGGFAALWALGRWGCLSWKSNVPEEDESAIGSDRPLPWYKALGALSAMACIGCLILLPPYFGFFYEGAGTHTRVEPLSRIVALTDNAFPLPAMATFTSPYFPVLKLLYSMQGVDFWPGLDPSMCSIYTGVIISVLACFAIVNRPRDRWRWWIAGIGLLSLICALGDATPIRGWLYDWVYPTRFFRYTSLFRAYYLISVVTLAIIGSRELAQSLQSSVDKGRRRFVLAAVLVAGVALFGFVGYLSALPALEISSMVKLGVYGHALTVWIGMVVVAVLLWRCSPSASRKWLGVMMLALAGIDALATNLISSPMINNFPGVERWRKVEQQHQANLDLLGNGLHRVERTPFSSLQSTAYTNDQMITKIPALRTYTSAENKFHLALATDPATKEMAIGSDRIWFSRQTAQIDLTDDALTIYRKRALQINGYPIVIHSPDQMLRKNHPAMRTTETDALTRLPAAERVVVQLIKYTPQELEFDVQCPGEGWLLVTDRWARSWKSEVNSQPQPVYGGNFIFRAVEVKKGGNHVSFTYRPLASPWLTLFSWSVLASVLLFRLRSIVARNLARERFPQKVPTIPIFDALSASAKKSGGDGIKPGSGTPGLCCKNKPVDLE
jgi:hypothetical protein